MNNSFINIGIVGLGYWGPNYARVVNELDGINLTWCCDINNTALSKFSKLYPSVKTTNNIQDLLKDESLDAVIIVTPAQQHYKIAKQCLEANKHILVEKPLSYKLSHAEDLVKLSKKKNRVLMVDHTFIFNPAVAKLKSLIQNGELGEIYYIYGAYNALGPIRRDVSAMWDLPHFIYVVNYLLEQSPLTVSAFGQNYLFHGTEDVVFMTFDYSGNIMFNLHCSWIDPVKIRKLTIVGNKKMVIFSDVEPEEKIRIYDKGIDINGDPNFANLQTVLRNGDIIIPKIENKEPLKEVILSFIESIKTRNIPMSDGKDGLNLVKILTAAQYSLKHKGQKVLIK